MQGCNRDSDEWANWPKLHNCDCQATRHPLWMNCISCGQILCEAHGPGPCCSYCGVALSFIGERSSNLGLDTKEHFGRDTESLPLLSRSRAKKLEAAYRNHIEESKLLLKGHEKKSGKGIRIIVPEESGSASDPGLNPQPRWVPQPQKVFLLDHLRPPNNKGRK
jgi:hypothetical protein